MLTALGFFLSASLSAVVMAAGFLTFGGAADGYILNNYAQTDRLAQVIGASPSHRLLHAML